MTILLVICIFGILGFGWELCDYPISMAALYGLITFAVGAGYIAARILA